MSWLIKTNVFVNTDLKFNKGEKSDVTSFRSAIEYKAVDEKINKRAETMWIEVIAFKDLANDMFKNLSKGDLVEASGEYQVKHGSYNGEVTLQPQLILNDYKLLKTKEEVTKMKESKTITTSEVPF